MVIKSKSVSFICIFQTRSYIYIKLIILWIVFTKEYTLVNLTKKFIKKYIYVVLYFAKECFPPSQMTNVELLAAKLCMASVLL